mgnify:CR=1 FL=1
MGGNIVCSYVEGDRMLAKTMKIEEQKDFLLFELGWGALIPLFFNPVNPLVQIILFK